MSGLNIIHVKIKFISLSFVGYDKVNLNTALGLNIKVANVPLYSPNAIAEHTVALLLTLNRKLIESNQRVKKLNFDLNNLTGFDLNNRTVGIIGTGRMFYYDQNNAWFWL